MFRYFVSHSLHKCGLLGVWQKLHKERITVLTIHSVLDDAAVRDWRPLRNYLPLTTFVEGIEFLSKSCQFISMAQAMDILEGKAPPVDNAVVLTFDDGYKNNFTLALPVLKSLGIPATFFVVTNRIDNRVPFWFDRVDFALQQNITDKYRLRVGGKTVHIESPDRRKLRTAMLSTFAHVMQAGFNDRDLDRYVDEVLEPLEELGGRRLTDHYQDSPCEIVTRPVLNQAIKSDIVTLGSHTHHHVRLTTMPDIDVTEELYRSADWLTNLTGERPNQFCYPNGSFDQRTSRLVAAAGYRCAVTCAEGQNAAHRQSLMQLRRVNWSNDATSVELLALVCGAYRDSLRPKAHELVDESGPTVATAGIATATID